jgi:sulfoxide reductase heme-binding subunit YedZ
MSMAAVGVHFFWITSRAAGVAALLASSAAVTLGLLMGGRLLKGRGVDLRVTHEALSLATIVALLVHALALLGDGYLTPSLADVSLPFVWSYQRFWSTIGIVGGWGLIILGLTYYVRGRIGPARWRRLHRFTALAWLLGVAHGIGEGTDAGAAWFLLTMAAVVVPAAALLVVRLGGAGARAPVAG